ncbi:hypothetical protein TNCV_4984592 [Trichonephila clavipes]|nr:hypothetical protein TNCV_4984592 [Trichonephila clavipes]
MATLPLDDKNEKPYTNCRLRDDATLSLYSSKQPKALWKDFSRKLSNYLEELLHSIEVKDVNSLKDLVLTNQLKRTVSRDVKGALFIIIWGDIKSSSELVQKLDHYEIARVQERWIRPRKHQEDCECPPRFESRTPLSCYGCGKPGYIKSKCSDCNSSKGDPAHFGILQVNSLSLSFQQKFCIQDKHKGSFRNCICVQWCKSFDCSRNYLEYPSPTRICF